ncbi:MAG: 30S ribosomal protein S18 [Deltaproteobacteria bacterium RBG_16_54_11]|jgi:small subunit ribosomal protein S18|nr:MAG: 30S ribosomal protein S18 [Deltaproteobacteria bacterium RBG_16_54_11]
MRRPANKSDARRRDRREYTRKKICRFCTDGSLRIDYKNYRLLRSFITERGRIIPRRISGNCAKHQRELTREIKRARHVALLPFTAIPK